MFVLEMIFFDLGPVVFGLAGFFLASYVYIKKNRKENLVCPLDGKCDDVVNSKFSKFLGLPVEVMGMIYYIMIVLFYGYFFLNPYGVSDILKFFVTGLTIGAFIFSIYLVFIQAFILKKWCTWCLFSAGFSTFIFVTAVFGADFKLIPLLAEHKGVIVFFHALAASLGVGAATITDIFFFKFLKDYRISEKEKNTMDTLSNVIWVALGLLVITGIGLFLPNQEVLGQSSKFLVKVVGVFVLIVNGIFLNLVVSPKMMEISYGGEHDYVKGELHVFRKLSYALGGISISSWYVVFLLGSLRSIPISFKFGLLIYVGILGFAILMSQVVDRKMVKRRTKARQNPNI